MSVSRGGAHHRDWFPVHWTIPGHFRVPAFLTSNIDSHRKMAVFTFRGNEAYRKPDYSYLSEQEGLTGETVIQWLVA